MFRLIRWNIVLKRIRWNIISRWISWTIVSRWIRWDHVAPGKLRPGGPGTVDHTSGVVLGGGQVFGGAVLLRLVISIILTIFR